eukprot:tig00020554_g10830.t1
MADDAERAELYQILLEANGIAPGTEQRVAKLEMFLYNCRGRMPQLAAFKNLTEISLIMQELPSMRGLETCVNLETLWLSENEIPRIEGLENCLRLKRLYLNSNRISKIENLDHLVDLEVLWLSDNRIKELQNLTSLPKLKSLWIARNQIEHIGDTLDRNTELEDLNMADNLVGCFKEVPNLCRLPQLRSLVFSDPHWGENPVCALCNYHTYVLYHLGQLTSLDTLLLTDEAKHLAEATYMKKKMYYNMRIKTLKRNTTNIVKRAFDSRTGKIAQINTCVSALIRQRRDIERELEELKTFGTPLEGARGADDAVYAGRLRERVAEIDRVIGARTVDIQGVDRTFQEFREATFHMSEVNISRLVIELETGGNIRLEDGKPEDVWYSSCIDLINSRFFSHEFAGFNVADIKVLRVTRIHNRFLRNRFEQRMEQMVDTSDPSYKRNLEYLFYGQHPQLPDQLQQIAEDGFPSAKEFLAMGSQEAVPLSNSVSTCDLPRIKAALSKQSALPSDRAVIPPGMLLITKVFLGRSSQEQPTGKGAISQELYPEQNSVYRTKPGDGKQRSWFIFDHALVLPEYLVAFEYKPKTATLPEPPASVLSDWSYMGLSPPQSETEAMDIAAMTRPLTSYIFRIQKSMQADAECGDPAVKELLAKPLPETVRPKVFLITDELVQKSARESRLSAITHLDLHGNSIRRIENLAACTALRTLILSFNEIQKIEGISELVQLTRLDLSFNAVRRVEGLKTLTQLQSLNLRNNNLYRIEDINLLRKHVSQLTELNLLYNPVCDVKSYRSLVLRRLPLLLSFDETTITDQDRAAAEENYASLVVSMIREHGINRRRQDWGLRIKSEGPAPAGGAEQADEAWIAHVEELELDHKRIRRIQNLEKCSNLRRLSLNDNEVSHIEGLERCLLLEELSLEENRIGRVEGLHACLYLKKLDLGKNRIAKVEGLEHLAHLAQLSLEDNEISSLHGLHRLTSLMELYIGNNRIADLKEVQQLKDLPKLIIADFSGNPVCDDSEYRGYVIYHLRKLKVLDGVGIEAGEQSAAREKYSGKLTPELLVERVGHKFFEHVRELDLSGCRIKEIAGCIAPDEFCNLRELNLDNNFVTDVAPLARLPCLAVLKLNHNRVDTAGGECSCAGLGALVQIEALQLGHNLISSIAALGIGTLTSLRSLSLPGNEITRVEGLGPLVQLQELVLDKNKIKYLDASSLATLASLRELRIEENGLKSLVNIGPLPRLQSLHLGANRISDLQDVDRLASLPSLFELSLANNACGRKNLYRATLIKKLPTLKILDGKEVLPEERDRTEMLFASDPRFALAQNSSPDPRPPAYAYNTAVKLPIAVKAMNFDAMHLGAGTPGAGSFQILWAPDGNAGGGSAAVWTQGVGAQAQAQGRGRPVSSEMSSKARSRAVIKSGRS